jgi:hypothetical protein
MNMCREWKDSYVVFTKTMVPSITHVGWNNCVAAFKFDDSKNLCLKMHVLLLPSMSEHPNAMKNPKHEHQSCIPAIGPSSRIPHRNNT